MQIISFNLHEMSNTFWGKNIPKYRLLKFLPSMLSDETIASNVDVVN